MCKRRYEGFGLPHLAAIRAGAIGSRGAKPDIGRTRGRGEERHGERSGTGGATSATGAATGEKGLKKDAIGFLDGLSIGLASTAPAYSLAAVIGSIVVAAGIHAPGVLLLSFVPMFFIAAAFYYMNRVDTDCGTTFSWVTRALGPYWGFMGGWAICTTGILVVGSLADVSAYYTYDLLGLEGGDGKPLYKNELAVAALAVVIIAVMTAICVIGTELSAHLQRVLTLGQVGILLLFAGAVFVRLIFDKVPDRSIDPELSWLSPFGVEYSAMLTGVLLAVFIYWGWESAVNLSEETEDSTRAPGLAGLASTVILVATYVLVTVALIAYAGLGKVEGFDDDAGVLGAVSGGRAGLGPRQAGGDRGDRLRDLLRADDDPARLAHLALDGGRRGAAAEVREHPPAFPDPCVRDDRGRRPGHRLVRAGEADLGELPLRLALGAVADDRLLLRAHRPRLRHLLAARALRSAKNFIFIGLAPLIGGGMLFYLLYESVRDLADPKLSYSGREFLGVGVPLAIAVVFTGLGFLIMVAWRLIGPPAGREFFARRAFEAVPHEVATGEVSQVEAIGVSEAAADAGLAAQIRRGTSRSGEELTWGRSSSATTARIPRARRSIRRSGSRPSSAIGS